MMSSGKRARSFVTEEEDSGFKFRRTSKGGQQAPAAPVNEHDSVRPAKAATRPQSVDAPAPGALPTLPGRRSSVFCDTRRSSCFGGAPAVRPRPQGVAPSELHKHLLPDLPGPLKMRQLVAWAAQIAGGPCAKAVMDGLLDQTINVSWYSRPADEQPVASPVPGPKNQELLDAIELYERQNSRLRSEESAWGALQTTECTRIKAMSVVNDLPVLACDADISVLARQSEAELCNVSEWIQSLPGALDGLQWTLAVIGSFEGHSRLFCERVLAQLRSRLFRCENPSMSSLGLLRALAASSRAS